MFFSPKTSADGLVFHYDTGNTVRSYLGEPTVNLLYSAGATNLTNGAGDIYGRCTKTDLGNGKYRFVNNGTGISTVRVYTNQGDLINGATYACSVYYENLLGSISIDWCDTGITGLNYSTNVSGRLGGYGTRGTYDGPYYFLDINFDSGGAVTLYNPQVEYKSHVTPFVAGTRSATQGLKDLTAANTINLSNVSFDSNAQMTFDGTDDYVDVGDLGTIGSSYSLECVFKSTSVTSYKNIFDMNYATYSGVTGNTGPRLEQISGQGISVIWSGNTTNNNLYNSTPTLAISANTYYHLAFVQNGTFGAIYLNGTLRDQISNVQGYLQTFGDFNLGRGFVLDPSRYASGIVDMFKIFNRALTADEVARNYNAIKSRFNIG